MQDSKFARRTSLLQNLHQVIGGFLVLHERKFGDGFSFEFGVFLGAGNGDESRGVALDEVGVQHLAADAFVGVFAYRSSSMLARSRAN